MTAEATTPTRCTICGAPMLSGQSAHEQCGGHLPENSREYVLWAAHHIEKQLKRPKTVEQLRRNMRPEYRDDVFDMPVVLLDDAGKLTRSGDKLKLAPPPRVSRRAARDDGSAGLFELPQRVPKRA